MASALLAITACDGGTGPTEPEPLRPAAPTNGAVAYLSLPASAPKAGDRIVVSVNAVRAADALTVGSFTFRISYDTTGLRFVRGESSAEGMVLASAAKGTITVAGAAAAGFVQETLGSVTLEVVQPSALQSLGLEMLEVNAPDFRDARGQTSVDGRLYRRSADR
jgi:hypothetical protein